MKRALSVIQTGFPPVYDTESQVLILGSFPSVKSRKIEFYYGNKQNRFWKMICEYFHESEPESTEGKKAFLKRRKIALWDMATECEIIGSSDASVKNATLADLAPLIKTAKLEKILLNGSLAFELFEKKYAQIEIPYQKMPSTSPANPHYSKEAWIRALDDVFLNRD